MMKWFVKGTYGQLDDDGLSVEVDRISLASCSDDEEEENMREQPTCSKKPTEQVFSDQDEANGVDNITPCTSTEPTHEVEFQPVRTSLFWDDSLGKSQRRGPPPKRTTTSNSLDVVCTGLQAAMGLVERSRWLNVVSKDPILSALVKELDDEFPTAMFQTEMEPTRVVLESSMSPVPNTTFEQIKVHARHGIDALEIRRKKTESTADMCAAIIRKAAMTDKPRDSRIAEMMSRFGQADAWSELDVVFDNSETRGEQKLRCVQIADDWVLGVHKAPNLRVGLDVQGWMCIDCGRKFIAADLTKSDRTDSLPRFCDYYGYYFCTQCHGGERTIIPAKVITAWNFTFSPVSDRAFRFLRSVHEVPVLRIGELSPELVAKVKPLRMVIDLRMKLKHMEQFIKMCAAASQEPTTNGYLGTMFASLDRYLLETSDTFSLNDLVRINNKDLLHDLEPLAKVARTHILKCETCSSRAHVCVRCNDISDRLFPFEDRVSRCNACGALSHSPKCPRREAPKTTTCPKCARIEKLRQRQTILVCGNVGDA